MPATKPEYVKVWDPLIRIFHWSLVLFFLVAYASEDWEVLHHWSGYVVAALIGFRLIWGLVGTRHARFGNFVKPPSFMMQYFKSMLSLKVRHYQGHNPLAAGMIISLLASIAAISFTGMLLIADQGLGPLAGTFLAPYGGEWLEGPHEFFANFTLLLIVTHVTGVLISSYLEGENLVRAMMTGKKKSRSDWQDSE